MPPDPREADDPLVAMACARGLAFDAARAAALRPPLDSLLARLAALAERLSDGTSPPPDRLPGPRLRDREP